MQDPTGEHFLVNWARCLNMLMIIFSIISIIVINIIVIIIMIVESTCFFPKGSLAQFFSAVFVAQELFLEFANPLPQTSLKNNSPSLTKKYSRKNRTNKLINGKKALLNRFYLFDHQGACSRRVPEPQWVKPWGSISTARMRARVSFTYAVRDLQRTATAPCLTTRILHTKYRSSPPKLGIILCT